MTNPKIIAARLFKKLEGAFGWGQTVSITVIVLLALAAGTAVLLFTNFGAPTTLTIASGPKGSTFERNAEKYKVILARQGVQVTVVPTSGSLDNFHRLSEPNGAVDAGFVLGGEVGAAPVTHLMSLGSLTYQPLMIFYRGPERKLLSEFLGKRLDIGEPGSGAHSLGMTLLKANGLKDGDGTRFIDGGDDLVEALLQNRADGIFVMGDSTSSDMLRRLLRTPDVRLFNVSQADGYARRFNYLNKLVLPKGSLDFGKDIPADDTTLIAPTVELVARDTLHPALSDLLLEAAREVHGTAGLFKKRSEFPAPLEHEFRISPDATRYYTSGKSFLYRTFPYGVASIITRIIAFVLPLALLLIPALKVAPALYRWRIESRIHRWYKALLDLERGAFEPQADPLRREALLKHLDHIEQSVSKIVVPAAFGDLFYGLRGHILFVRNTLLAQAQSRATENDAF